MKKLRHGINWERALDLRIAEQAAFVQNNPASSALAQQAAQHMLFGVPMHWMRDWSTPFSLTIREAAGARFTDADGHHFLDFCLGDTGAMFGHSPAPVARAIARQATRGYTAMLPSDDAVHVSALLAARFGLPFWQFALSASDANRFVLRWIRAATKRTKVLVFNGCYHGTVDDVFVDLDGGLAVQRSSLLGQVHDLTRHTLVVEFNDLASLDRALGGGDVACVLAEPAMTNIGMVLPRPDYWEQASAIMRRHGTLLVMDETHTISSGPQGYARAHGIEPDALVVGKAIAGGIPAAVYGFTQELAQRVEHAKREAPAGHSGVGTTLTANMFAMAAMRANLEQVMTRQAYGVMFERADRLAQGLRQIIAKAGLPWCVTQLGARLEFQFGSTPPLTGSEAGFMLDPELEQIIHLYLLNRGILITPFHNMLLVSPETGNADVDRLLHVFEDCIGALTRK